MNKDKVLVIEDNKGSRQAIQILLELNGIGAVCTGDVLLALKNLEQDAFDVILCSIALALPGGGNFLALIKNNARLYKIPVIILAETADENDLRQCMNLGADDYITRPSSGKVLISSIKSRLEVTRRFNNFHRDEVSEQLFSLLNKNFNQELYTPLNGIINATLLIESMDGVAEIEGLQDLMQIIYSASYRMQRATQNIRTYSLLNTTTSLDNVQISTSVSLRDILKSVTFNYSNPLSPDYKQMEVQVIQDGLWEGPDELLRVIFTELVDNAVKYAQSDFIPCVKLLAFNNNFNFSVTYAVKENIYFSISDIKPFKKFHIDLSRNGLGLGLYVCKLIAEKMGYQFSVIKENNMLTFCVESGQ